MDEQNKFTELYRLKRTAVTPLLVIFSLTLLAFQFLSFSIAFAKATVPLSPVSIVAISQNVSARVSWSAPNNGGSSITGYTVTSTPGSKTCTTTGATSCTVTGLTNGTAYTFTVRARNLIGTSPSSKPSLQVIPQTTPPGTPQPPSALSSSTRATVSWSAPNNGGSQITGYTVTSSPDSLTCTTTGATSCTVTGLTNGTAYTFTVTATNAIGSSNPSLSSASLIPSGAPLVSPGIASFKWVQSCYGSNTCSLYPGHWANLQVSIWQWPSSSNGAPITGTEMVCPGGGVSSSWWNCEIAPGSWLGQTVQIPIYEVNVNGRGPATTITLTWMGLNYWPSGWQVTYP